MITHSAKWEILLLFSALIACFAINSAMHQPSLWAIILAAILWGGFYQGARQRSLQKKVLRGLFFVGGILLAGGLLLNGWAEPSHAVLLSGAQDFFSTQLTSSNDGSQTTAVNLIFNVARGLYIFYLVIAILNAWNSARQDEDWIPVIKVPVMSLLAIFGLDIMTALVIPGATT